MIEDLQRFGFQWQEGPFHQSERGSLYRASFEQLRAAGLVYPCTCSRRDILNALGAPHEGKDEPVYPGTCRPASREDAIERARHTPRTAASWRFWLPENHTVEFEDGFYGPQALTCGQDFGDFVVWRSDDLAAYQLATVVDDAALRISEVVRGQDLLRSTARQLLLYEALGFAPPDFYHCPLMRDAEGMRLAKRNDSLSLRALEKSGRSPRNYIGEWSPWC
jgi:glutamyl-tRNA synthetase